jgi:dTDP-3-amino-3,4,6-trideoxy-alpha-D-glucose transaminase
VNVTNVRYVQSSRDSFAATIGWDVPFVDLSASNELVRGNVLRRQSALIDRGAFVNGEVVAEFEQSFAGYCGREACVGLASGLDALRLALLALGVGQGDGVLVPAMTFAATFEAVAQVGAIPIPVDVRGDDCGIDPDAAASAIDERTSALVPVHLYGQMADMRSLVRLADARQLLLVEDACQAHGAQRDGLRAGSASEAAAFSFYPAKNLGAWGDAGALVTDRPEVTARVRALREHGQVARYRSTYVGYTARLDAMQAVVLLEKLAHIDDWNLQRASAAASYSMALEGIGDVVLPQVVRGSEHVWHLYTIRTQDPTALAAFLAERGISTGRHYPEPPHLSAAFEYLGRRRGEFPVAEAIARETLSLPLFPGITEAQLAAVVDGVRAYFAHGRHTE